MEWTNKKKKKKTEAKIKQSYYDSIFSIIRYLFVLFQLFVLSKKNPVMRKRWKSNEIYVLPYETTEAQTQSAKKNRDSERNKRTDDEITYNKHIKKKKKKWEQKERGREHFQNTLNSKVCACTTPILDVLWTLRSVVIHIPVQRIQMMGMNIIFIFFFFRLFILLSTHSF